MTDTGAYSEVQIENEIFRVTKWTIKPGGVIPQHVHEHNYVVLPQMNGKMHVKNADGTEFVAELTLGSSYSREAGVEHEVSNPYLDTDVVFIEVECLCN